MKKPKKINNLALLLLIFLSALFLECVFFNQKAFLSRFYSPVSADLSVIAAINGDNVNLSEDGNLVISPASQVYLVLLADGVTDSIDLKNIGIAGYVADGVEEWYDYVGEEKYATVESYSFDADIYITDEDHSSSYYEVAEKTVGNSLGEENIIAACSAGKANNLIVILNPYIGNQIVISSITFNDKVPFCFSGLRFVIVVLLLSFLVFFGAGRDIWTKNALGAKGLFALCALLPFVICAFAILTNEACYTNMGFSPYYELARALASGRLSLLREVPKQLTEIANPYDVSQRDAMVGARYLFDYAYYNGNYYVYFGIVPCLIFYLPYYLVTGKAALNSVVILFSMAAYFAGLFFALHSIVKKYFKNVSVAVFAIAYMLIAFSSGMALVLSNPVAYYIPMICGNAFALWGVYCWNEAFKDDGRCRYAILALGSFFIALIAGCRPNVEIVILLAVPLLYRDMLPLKKDSQNVERKNLLIKWITFIAPFVAVAVPLMLYNYYRFDSCFDFGSEYNLTSVNVYYTDMSFKKTVMGIFFYLFAEPTLSGVFPYLQPTIIGNDYIGELMNEGKNAGMFLESLFMLLAFRLSAFKKCSNDERRTLNIFRTVLIVSVIALVLLDTYLGGMVNRYKLDFSWMMGLAAVLVLFDLDDKNDNGESIIKQYSSAKYVLIILLILVVVFQMLSFLSQWMFPYGKAYPDYYYGIINSLRY